MADASGARVEGPYTYDAYGNCFLGTTTTSCTTLASSMEPFRYTGQRFDADTGLYYYRARYYGPGIGRFYETDPVGYGPDINWYSYVGNDPTDKTDPTGETFAGAVAVLATTGTLDAEEDVGTGFVTPASAIAVGVTTVVGVAWAGYELVQPAEQDNQPAERRGEPVPGTGKKAGKPQYGSVKPGVSGPPKVNRPTHGPKKSDAPKEAGRQGKYGGVIGSRGDRKKMGGRQDSGHNGGPPHGHPPEGDGEGHLWERPRNQ